MPIPKSFSATSVQGFEGCAARWISEWFLKAPDANNSAAALGTACHGALEYFTGTVDMHMFAKWYFGDDKQYRTQYRKYMTALFTDEYERLFGDDDGRHGEGLELLYKWLDRQDEAAWPAERTIISREVKTNFMLKTTAGEIPFNYVWDRCDRIDVSTEEEPDAFEIEVIDYKTTALPLNGKALRGKVQARMYAVAAMIAYPQAKRIWVTFDQLRHDPTSIVFTREENRQAWKYLNRVAERIIAAPDGTTQALDEDGEPLTNADGSPVMIMPAETINPECRWCIRKSKCATLQAHVNAGGPMSVSTADEAAVLIADIDDRVAGLNKLRDELEPVILRHVEETGDPEFIANGVAVTLSGRRIRKIDAERARQVVPDSVIAEYGALSVTVADKIEKDPTVAQEVKMALRGLVTFEVSEPKIRAKRLSAVEDDE